MAKNHYKVLGVDKRATPEELKQAYRTLARRYHPDVTGDDPEATERFKQINDAYAVLSDPQRRRQYDLFGDKDDIGVENPFSVVTEPIKEVFKDLFAGDPDPPRPGHDVETPLDVSFTESWLGADLEVETFLLRPCGTCEGLGFPLDAKMMDCPRCHGSGKSKRALGMTRTCSRCKGTGKVPKVPCRDCNGKGATRKKERLKVAVPPGVSTGTRLRLKGRGPVGTHGAQAGDLYVKVYVGDHPRFLREGDSLRTTVQLPLKTALVGGELEVPLPDGHLTLKVPPQTQGGQMFRVRGRGFAHLGKADRGDFFVQVKLQMPSDLDADQAAALAEQLPE